jgi:hypothetical protein
MAVEMRRVPIRGGNWNNGGNAGLGALNLNNRRSNSNNNVGFRPAFPSSKLQYRRLTGLRGTPREKESYSFSVRENFYRYGRPVGGIRQPPSVPLFRKRKMARTYNNLWEDVIDFEHLYRAYRAAKKGKRYRYESLEFKRELEENLIILQNELIWKTYKPLPLRQFYVYEPKQRIISAPAFRDRVVHHSLCSVIEPILKENLSMKLSLVGQAGVLMWQCDIS